MPGLFPITLGPAALAPVAVNCTSCRPVEKYLVGLTDRARDEPPVGFLRGLSGFLGNPSLWFNPIETIESLTGSDGTSYLPMLMYSVGTNVLLAL